MPDGERPEWVQEREERAPARMPGEPPRDPEAAARRAAEREERVAAGVEDLRLWLRDAVRGGLAAGRLRTWDEWDGFAARMVDAQAPGAASRLRSLGSVAAGRPDGWPERLLSGLGLLHLLCEAHGRADGPLRDDVRALLGFNVAREDVLAGPHVRDRWTVLAARDPRAGAPAGGAHMAVGPRDRPAGAAAGLRAAGRAAGAAPAGGAAVDAALAFYPGATPLRALVAGETGGLDDAPGTFGTGGAEDALTTAAAAIAANPWLDEWPVALAAAVPDSRDWTLSAPDGSLPLGGGERSRWRLLALSGGRPVSVFGVWTGAELVPLAAADGSTDGAAVTAGTSSSPRR